MSTRSKAAVLTMILASTAIALPSWGAKAITKVTPEYKKAQNDFVDACRESFKKSSTPSSEEVSKTICECTAKDSKNQGATASALRKEAAEIRKDAKHEIKDENVMNAFRWCTIELMRKADAQEHGDAS
jgi:hypothetical protein